LVQPAKTQDLESLLQSIMDLGENFVKTLFSTLK